MTTVARESRDRGPLLPEYRSRSVCKRCGSPAYALGTYIDDNVGGEWTRRFIPQAARHDRRADAPFVCSRPFGVAPDGTTDAERWGYECGALPASGVRAVLDSELPDECFVDLSEPVARSLDDLLYGADSRTEPRR